MAASASASPSQPATGLIAILDALGAADYSRDEAAAFLKSRDSVIARTNEKAEANLKRLDMSRLKRFTFNDTVVLVYVPPKAMNIDDVEAFCHVLRVFEILSIANNILFRGAFSIGEFYSVDDRTNTVMGPAVSDAAAWYGRADWIGINATPYATIFIDSLLERTNRNLEHVLVDYAVPLKDKSTRKLKAVNWPKAFYVTGLRPERGGERTKAKLLTLLSEHRIPQGTESKYFNAIAFFDHIEKTQQPGRPKRAAAPPG